MTWVWWLVIGFGVVLLALLVLGFIAGLAREIAELRRTRGRWARWR